MKEATLAGTPLQQPGCQPSVPEGMGRWVLSAPHLITGDCYKGSKATAVSEGLLRAVPPRPPPRQVLSLHSLRKLSSWLYTVGSSTHFPDEKRRERGRLSGGVRTSLLSLPWDSAGTHPHLPVLPTFPVTSLALQLSRDDVLSGLCNHLPPTLRGTLTCPPGEREAQPGVGGPVKSSGEAQGPAPVHAGQGRPQPRRDCAVAQLSRGQGPMGRVR